MFCELSLSSLTKEGEASESFQEIAYRDEFEATNMYDDIQVYGEEDSDSNGLDTKRSDPDLSSLSRGPVRTDSVSTEVNSSLKEKLHLLLRTPSS